MRRFIVFIIYMSKITTDTNSVISELNKKLKDNCTDLELTIRPFSKNEFKLCLLNDKVIASDLIINNDDGTFNILSTTVDKYQRRGYNKFLTAVSIFLADTMTKSKELYSSTNVKARIHILSEYRHRMEEERSSEEEERSSKEKERSSKEKERRSKEKKRRSKEEERKFVERRFKECRVEECQQFNFFVPIAENKIKAMGIIDEWITNKCVKNKANDMGGGKKTRRNKQRQKNKTQRLYK